MMKRLSQFHKDTEGAILIIAGLWFLVFVALAGAGYDFGKRELIRLKLQQATDAAALAGALLPTGTSDAERKAEVMRFYMLNFPSSYISINRPSSPTITITSTVTVSANVDVPTAFIGNLKIPTLPATARSVVTIGSKQVDFDLVMVIDESSSNRDGCPDCGAVPRIVKLRDAMLTMVDTVFTGASNPNVRMGMIGYSARIIDKWGLTSDKSQAQDAANSIGMQNANYDHYGLAAAYNMVTGNVDPATANGRETCSGVDNPAYLDPYMKPPYTTQVFSMQTLIDNGINWSWPPCDPLDNTAQVPPPRTARADGKPVSPVKNVVFITDGYIMYEPPPCIIDPSTGLVTNPGPNCPNYSAFLAECTKLKNAGVTVFTISYVSPVPQDVGTLKQCASTDPATGQPRYFFAPGSNALQGILKDIGTTIRKVRIAE